MDSSKRRVGRPKAAAQTGPLVLSEKRARKKIEIEMAAETVEELAEYARWIELSDGMSTVDATAATVEFALRRVFRQDRLWQQHRRGGGRAVAVSEPTPAVPGRSSASPSLPPPSVGASRLQKQPEV
jgi:hypothetical protein